MACAMLGTETESLPVPEMSPEAVMEKTLAPGRRAGVRLLMLLACGVGIASGLPHLGWSAVALLSLGWLYFMTCGLADLTARQAMAQGLALGLGYFVLALHWIGYAFLVDAAADLWMMPFAVGGLALMMACYWALGFGAACMLARRGMPHWIALAASLSVFEILRGILFSGFPWAAPGLIPESMGGVLQVASLVGMQGLTFLFLLWGLSLGCIVDGLKQRHPRWMVAAALLLTLPASWAYGQYRLGMPEPLPQGTKVVRVVQPNISQSDKWRSDNSLKIFEQLLQLTSAKASLKPGVIVWPESAVSFLLEDSPAALRAIGDRLEPGQVLLTGAIRRELRDGAERYFTSILMIDDEGKVLGHYDKWRLVPGGEFLPLGWLLEPLGFRKVVSLPESFTAGGGPGAMEVPGFGAAALLICYEAIFPDHLLPPARTVSWIVNVTNDGWFGLSSGPYQHVAQVRMRAVEQGLPVVRAANSGVSTVLDGKGRVMASLGLGETGSVDAILPPVIGPTPYSKGGLGLSILLILLLTAITSFATVRLSGTFVESTHF